MSDEKNSFRDTIATADKDGRRLWIYPTKPKGKLYSARTYVSWLFAVILPVFIITTKKQTLRLRLKDALLFFLISCSFMLFWILVVNNVYGEHNLFYKNFFEAGSFFRYMLVAMQTVSMITSQLFAFPLPFLFLLGLVISGCEPLKIQ